jgi:hypothetical protein
VELRERVEEVAVPPTPAEPQPTPAIMLFQALSADDLLAIGVPPDWIMDVQGGDRG